MSANAIAPVVGQMSVTGVVTYRHTYNSNDLAELMSRVLSFDEILDLKKMSSEARLNAWEKKTAQSGVGLSRVSTPEVTGKICCLQPNTMSLLREF